MYNYHTLLFLCVVFICFTVVWVIQSFYLEVYIRDHLSTNVIILILAAAVVKQIIKFHDPLAHCFDTCIYIYIYRT